MAYMHAMDDCGGTPRHACVRPCVSVSNVEWGAVCPDEREACVMHDHGRGWTVNVVHWGDRGGGCDR